MNPQPNSQQIKRDHDVFTGWPISSVLFLASGRAVTNETSCSPSRELQLEAIRFLLKGVALAVVFVVLLGGVGIAVYQITHKVVGEASVLVSTLASVTFLAFTAHWFQRRQRKQTEILVNELREHERDLFKRLDKEIKSIVTKDC
jgi:hypothetical protein